jgi:hypothetical protein
MPNPDLWLKFDDPAGSVTAADSSGNGRTASAFNGVTFGAAGRRGLAASFDGVNDYVKVPAWAYGINFTVSAWVNLPDFIGFYVVGSNGVGSGSVGGFTFYIKPSGSWVYACQLQASDGSSMGEAVGSSLQPYTGQWVHLAATYDGNQIQLYLNGVADGAPFTTTGGGKINAQSTLDFTSGANNPSSPGNFMHGRIDDLRYYSSVFTAAQVLALFKEGQRIIFSGKSRMYP